MKTKINWCKCKGHNSKVFSRIVDFYSKNFIPDDWMLDYETIQEEQEGRHVYLIGYCKDCGGFMRSGTSLPVNWNQSLLLAEIWRDLKNFRPYLHGLPERDAWYKDVDRLDDGAYGKILIDLMKPQDRPYVEGWVNQILNGGIKNV